MAKDFRAGQIRTTQIIASGSTANKPSLLIASASSPGVDFDASGIDDSDLMNGVGVDVFLFVSGASGSQGTTTQGTTLFRGDVVVSGTLFSSVSGTISPMPVPLDVGGSDTQIQFNDGGILAGEAGLTFTKSTQVMNVYGGISGSGGTHITGSTIALTGSMGGDGAGLAAVQIRATNTWGDVNIRAGNGITLEATGTSRFVTMFSDLSLAAHAGTVDIDANVIDIDADGGDGAGLVSIDTNDTSQGITIGTATSGVPVSIGHATSEVTVNDNLTVTGDLTVNGTTTTIDTTNLSIEDPLIQIAAGAGSSNQNGGIAIASGSTATDQALVLGRVANDTWGAGRLDVEDGELSGGDVTGMVLTSLRASEFQIGSATPVLSSSDGSSITLASAGGAAKISITPGSGGVGLGNTAGSNALTGSSVIIGTTSTEFGGQLPNLPGDDTSFFASGTIGSKDSTTRGTATFGGDVVASGSVTAIGGLSGSLTQLSDGSPYLVQGSNVTITSASNGAVTIAATAAAAGATSGTFNVPSPSEFVTTASVSFAGGEGVGYTADLVGEDTFFFASGTIGAKDGTTAGTAVFGGDVYTSGTLYASTSLFIGEADLTEDGDGDLTITAGRVVFSPSESDALAFQVVTNGAAGMQLAAGSGGLGLNSGGGILTVTSSQVIVGSQSDEFSNTPPSPGDDTSFFVSGTLGSKGTSTRGAATFGGDAVVSGTLVAELGLSGSLTQLSDGSPYLVQGANITITSASNGAVTITGAAGGGGGGDEGAQYLVLAVTASLDNERVITPGTGLSGTDGGAGSTWTIDIDDTVVATVSGTTFTGATVHDLGMSGSLTHLSDGTSYLLEGANITITSSSNGAVTIASTGGGGSSLWTSDFADSTYITGSVLLAGGSGFTQVSDAGEDVISYIDGTAGGKDDPVAGVTVFAGDIVTSGAIWGGYDANVAGTVAGQTYLRHVSDTISFSDTEILPGADFDPNTAFYVSGALGSLTALTPGFAGFGGDAQILGNLAVGQGGPPGTYGITGSITEVSLGQPYLIAGSNVTVTSESNGSITIASTGGGGSSLWTSDFLDSTYITGSVLLAGSSGHTQVSDAGTDVQNYINGISAAKDGPAPGVTLFDGDIVTSGSIWGGYDVTLAGRPAGGTHLSNLSDVISFSDTAVSPGIEIDADTSFYVSGSPGAYDAGLGTGGGAFFLGDIQSAGAIIAGVAIPGIPNGLTGSLTTIDGFTPYLQQGANVTITTGVDGSVTIASTAAGGGAGINYWDSTVPDAIVTTGSVGFVSTSGDTSADDHGNDIFFWVSGSSGLKDGATQVLSAFGGDVVISGTLYGGYSAFNNGTVLAHRGDIVTIQGGALAFADYGEDAALIVSGAVGSQDGTTRGVSVFGGDVVISGSLSVKESSSEYGGLYNFANVAAQTIVSGVEEVVDWNNAGGLNMSSSNGVTPDASSNGIFIDNPGTYFVSFQASFSAPNSTTHTFRVYVNSNAQNQVRCRRKLGTGGDVGSCSGAGIVEVTAADSAIELWVEANTTSITLQTCQLAVQSL